MSELETVVRLGVHLEVPGTRWNGGVLEQERGATLQYGNDLYYVYDPHGGGETEYETFAEAYSVFEQAAGLA